MDTLFADLRYAVRTLRRGPGFTIAALAILAIGIGATASIFSVVNGVLLRPLAVADPDRLIMVRASQLERGWTGASLTGPDFADIRRETTAFELVAAATMRNVVLTGRGDPAEVIGAIVSREFFPVMRATPLVGRFFTPDEFAGRQPPDFTVLSEAAWRSRFGADPSVVGRSVIINGTSRVIIGVAPASVSWIRAAGSPELYFAFPEVFSETGRGNHMFEVLARLAPAATVEAARAELATLSAGQARDFPETNKGWLLTADRITDLVVGPVRRALYLLLGAVGFVLLIVCANVASLLLARATSRYHEMAIRRALGAPTRRIVRHLAAESVLLAAGGGVLGTLLALWGVDFLRTSARASLPRIDTIAVDGSVLVFTVVVTAFTAIVCGVLPAVVGARSQLQDALQEGSRVAAPRRGRIGRGALVIGEVMLAVVLLAGAGLMMRSFERLRDIPLGFDPDNVIAIDLDLPMARYAALHTREQFVKRVEARIRKLPGVSAVGTTRALPLESGGPDVTFTIEGRAASTDPALAPNAFFSAVTPDYFRTMRMSIIRGRSLLEADDHATANRVVVINETMARRFWGSENPVGRRLMLGDGKPADIVGVVRDVRQRFLTNEVAPQMFVAWAQAPEVQMSMVVRTAVDPTTLVPAMHRDVWAVDPNLPVEEWTMTSLMTESLDGTRFQTTLLVSFATVALLLAAIGVYALLNYAVLQRTREIGVRMALGAARRDVVWMVLRQGARLAFWGIVLGLVSAFFLTQTMQRVLYGIRASDPLTHTTAAVVLALVALAATYIPARRAAAVDPLVALRS